MKIFSAAQIREWDKQSIHEEGIESEVLMERAAGACYRWLIDRNLTKNIRVFCGKGNNGGDGLALARLLLENQIDVSVYILETGKAGSNDFQLNLLRLHTLTTNIHFIHSSDYFPSIQKDDIIIDALFGTGLNKPIDGVAAELVDFINKNEAVIISIDIPSGLFSDVSSLSFTVIKADYTLCFTQKLAFLLAENEQFFGRLEFMNIGLSRRFELEAASSMEMIDVEMIRSIIKPRRVFSHKGDYGNALLFCGTRGMMGAAVLAARGCLSSGAGKVFCYVEVDTGSIIQVSVPEVICKLNVPALGEPGRLSNEYDAIAIGPGLGTNADALQLLTEVLSVRNIPLVIDADALNLIAQHNLHASVPPGSVITPHPKEFDRLFGVARNDFERLKIATAKAAEYGIYIILKGHHSAIITPKGRIYFNNTGNAGMAKGGTGDILTGMVCGLCAQGYLFPEAAIAGVFIHGLAGDLAAKKYSQQAMSASALVNEIGTAWNLITN
jgi:ADP-dependent NAD(P)H-hydrate dehydratase / NAD(P)H-hydrate epimerase